MKSASPKKHKRARTKLKAPGVIRKGLDTKTTWDKMPWQPTRADGRYSRSQAANKRVSSGPLAERLRKLVADAVRDHARSMELRERDYDRRKKLCDRIVNGIHGRAHGWCLVFRGDSHELVEAGLARTDWFKDKRECTEVLFAGRKIELYRPYGSEPYGGEYELTICYTDSELDDAWESEDE